MNMEVSGTAVHAEDELSNSIERIWRAKWFILALGILVGGITLLVTYLLPPVWRAETTIMLPIRTPLPLGMTPGMVDTSAVGSVFGGPSPVRMLARMLESETVANHVLERTNLTRKKLKSIRDVNDRETSNSITLSIKHRDPKLAVAIVEWHLEALRKMTVELSTPPLITDVRALQQAVAEKTEQLREAEENLERYQEQISTAPVIATSPQAAGPAVVLPAGWLNQLTETEVELARLGAVIDEHVHRIERQSGRAVEFPTDIPAARVWRDRLVGLEYELRMALVTSSPESPHIKRIREQIDVTRGKLTSEVQKYLQAVREDLLDPTTDLKGERLADSVAARIGLEARAEALRKLVDLAPKEAKEYQRLLREVTTLSAILQQLRTHLELARLQENRDPISWQVMDPPGIYAPPVNKRYVLFPALGVLGGVLLGCALSLVRPQTRQS